MVLLPPFLISTLFTLVFFYFTVKEETITSVEQNTVKIGKLTVRPSNTELSLVSTFRCKSIFMLTHLIRCLLIVNLNF